MDRPLIIIYTGNGKGKTCASVGQALRAHGQGLRVGFVQFMKRDEQAGEQNMLRTLLKENFHAGGRGFFRHEDQRTAHSEAARLCLLWAKKHMPQLDLLVLDEILYALHAQLINQDDVVTLLEDAREHNTHIVLSGRHAPQWLQEKAHLVTVMNEVKHPWQQGIHAQKGIEF